MAVTTQLWKKIVAIMFLGFCVFWVIYWLYKDNHLTRHYKITKGVVTHISPPPSKSNTRQIDYEFFLDGKKYTGNGGSERCDTYKITDLSWLLVNREFYIAYDTTDPTISKIILREKDAIRFNLPVSDTIRHYDSIVNCEHVWGAY